MAGIRSLRGGNQLCQLGLLGGLPRGTGIARNPSRERLVFSDDFLMAVSSQLDLASERIELQSQALVHCVEKLPNHHRELIQLRYGEHGRVEVDLPKSGARPRRCIVCSAQSAARCMTASIERSNWEPFNQCRHSIEKNYTNWPMRPLRRL